MLGGFKKLLIALVIVALPSLASAQSGAIIQSGPVTPGHALVVAAPNVVQDAGTSVNGGFSSLGVTSSGSCGIGINSTVTTSPYYELCWGIGNFTFSSFGGASPIPFNFNINGGTPLQLTATSVIFPSGTSVIFPSGSIALSSLVNIPSQAILGNATNSSGVVTSTYKASSTNSTIATVTGSLNQNDVVCLADANGTLKDCGGTTPGVTSVATGTGLTGGPITGTGTISATGALADIAGISFSQGDLIYYNGSSHLTNLGHGTSGQLLSTGGAAANPSWITASGTGTVTSIATNAGLTGGTITASGTIGLAAISSHDLLANITSGSAAPFANTLTATIDAAISSTQGGILERGASTWGTIGPGGAGTLLQGVAASNDPAFTVTPTLGISGTSTGTIGLSGSGSGVVTIQPQAAAGTYNFNLPNTAGTAGQVLTSGGGGSSPMTWGNAGGLSQINIKSFLSSGTYTPTSGMKYAIVYAWGGGGGAGGTDSTGGGGSNGTAGGSTSLGSLVVAPGGGGGGGNSFGSDGGAAGAASSGGTGTLIFQGQAGTAGSVSANVPGGLSAFMTTNPGYGFGGLAQYGGNASGGSGGAGAYVQSTVSAASVGASQTVTIGTAGAGGAQGGGGGGAPGLAGIKGYLYIVEYQ